MGRSMEDAVISESILNIITERIKAFCNPIKVILFGSHAREEADNRSDIDILVIEESNIPRYKRSAPLYTLLADLPVEVDIVVYTPDEVKSWSDVKQAFITTAVNEGRVLYERQN